MSITTINFVRYDEEGNEISDTLPAKFVICNRCHGKGTHVNPSIDSHGITEEEREQDWSPHEWESYMSGGYDVACHKCAGEKVTKVVDEDYITPKLKPLYNVYVEQEREKEIERRQDQRDFEMGY